MYLFMFQRFQAVAAVAHHVASRTRASVVACWRSLLASVLAEVAQLSVPHPLNPSPKHP